MVEQWLKEATRHLPEWVRDEIAAHYADAYEDYLLQGHPPQEAGRLALADLGDAVEVGEGLRQVHLTGRVYRRAALAGVAPSLTLILIAIPATMWGDGGFPKVMIQAIFVLMILILSAVTIDSTRRILRGLSQLANVQLDNTLILGGMLILMLPTLLSNWVLDRVGVMLVNNPAVSFVTQPTDSLSMMIIQVSSGLGILLVALGWMRTGWALSVSHLKLLRMPYSQMMMANGVILFLLALSVAAFDLDRMAFAASFSSLLGVVMYCAFTVLFLRASREKGSFVHN